MKTLSNFDLEGMMTSEPYWNGTLMRDEIVTPGNYIINLDSSTGPGTHWVALATMDDRMFYFDSFGLPPPDEVMVVARGYRLFFSPAQIQKWDSTACGYYCVMMLKQLHGGKTFYDFIHQFRQEPNQINEKLLLNFARKYNLLKR